ncbi:MAG: TolC family protein [Candidatus Eremiobacteraeota bacterium]|nr:TolC family protein [Candidatus Eremiobacteraeota bacterium]
MKLALVFVAIVQIFASCVPPTPSAPPDAQMPQTYRGQASTATSLGNVPWRQLYDDPVLQGLIQQALTKNFNVGIAYTSILQAEASLGITAANQSLFVNGFLEAPYYVTTGGNKPPSQPTTALYPQLGIAAQYQVDLFGKLASATGAARDALLSTEAAKDTVLATVVADVAGSYFQLRELDDVLTFTQAAVADRQVGVRLMNLRVQGGESSLQDLRQAEQSLYEITQNVPALQQSIAQTENALAVLTGDYPHVIPRGLPLLQQVHMPDVPQTGVASELLQRRPDIREAEYAIAEAAGNVDVARKLLYPTLTLGATAAVGGQTLNGVYPNAVPSLASLQNVNGVFYGPLGLFSIVPELLQPIFNGGQIRSQIHLAQAQQQQITISYLQTVHQAFSEVSSDITTYDESRLRTVQLQKYEAASLDSVRLAKERYENGYTSYLEVLDAQTRGYQAQTDLAQGQLNERLALVQLYLALGGGWQQSQQ